MQIKDSQAADAPALPKPSLLARKDIRDSFDSALPELTETIDKLLKDTYKINIDFPQVYAHCVTADSGQNNIGSYAKGYLDSFIYSLKKYTDDGEYDDAIQTFNDLVTERKITIAADNKITYEGCSVKNGIFEINYNPKQYGTNSSYSCSNMDKEIDKALHVKSPNALPLLARKSIRDAWEAKKEALVEESKEELLGTDVKYMVDYDAIWKTIVDAKNNKQDVKLEDIGPYFGDTIYNYFSGFLYQIKYQFKKDELMVEGFTEAVPTAEVWIEVVPKDKMKSGYSECKIENGKVVLRTTPLNWGTNSSYVAEKLSELL